MQAYTHSLWVINEKNFHTACISHPNFCSVLPPMSLNPPFFLHFIFIISHSILLSFTSNWSHTLDWLSDETHSIPKYWQSTSLRTMLEEYVLYALIWEITFTKFDSIITIVTDLIHSSWYKVEEDGIISPTVLSLMVLPTSSSSYNCWSKRKIHYSWLIRS